MCHVMSFHTKKETSVITVATRLYFNAKIKIVQFQSGSSLLAAQLQQK